MPSKINLNQRVRFTLTELGEKTPASLLEKSADGSRECPLWGLMHSIGPDLCMGMGGNLIVNNDLEIVSSFIDDAIAAVVLRSLKAAVQEAEDRQSSPLEFWLPEARKAIHLAEGN